MAGFSHAKQSRRTNRKQKTPGRTFWRLCGQMAGSAGVFFLVLTIFQSTSPQCLQWQEWIRQSMTSEPDLAPVMEFFYQWDSPYEEAAIQVDAELYPVQEAMAIPVTGKVLNGYRHDEKELASRFAEGIWIAAEPDAIIKSAYTGTVTGIWEEADTCTIEISHANGLITVYANCAECYVNLNQPVKKGEPIGHTTTQQHEGNFYFAARYLGEPVNPLTLLNEKTAISS